jgi:hypothetical protein
VLRPPASGRRCTAHVLQASTSSSVRQGFSLPTKTGSLGGAASSHDQRCRQLQRARACSLRRKVQRVATPRRPRHRRSRPTTRRDTARIERWSQKRRRAVGPGDTLHEDGLPSSLLSWSPIPTVRSSAENWRSTWADCRSGVSVDPSDARGGDASALGYIGIGKGSKNKRATSGTGGS